MPKLIIMNAATEQMLGGDLEPSQRLLATKAGWRHLWFVEQGDVVVMPCRADDIWLRYVGASNGFDPSSISFITLDEPDGRHDAVSDEQLLSPRLMEQLKPRIRRGTAWRVMALYYTAGVVELAARLGIEPPAGSGLAAQRGIDLFNRKSHFRQLAAGIGLPLPEGSIAYDAATLEQAVRRHIASTGTVVVKQDNNVLGQGNVALTTGRAEPLSGVRDVLEVRDNWSKLAATLWGSMANRWSHQLVVESYHAASHVAYVEYFIEEDGRPRFLDNGLLRMTPNPDPESMQLVWMGLDIPAALPPFAAGTLVSESTRFASLAADAGYRGFMNIDAIVSEEGKLLFNEVNGRWGGCSVLHVLATRLLGEGYANRYCVSSLRNIDALPLDDVWEGLKATRLALEPGKTEGVLVLATDEALTKSMECMIVGATWDRVRQLEAALLVCLDRCRAALRRNVMP